MMLDSNKRCKAVAPVRLTLASAALFFCCVLMFPKPAGANEADTFSAMLELANTGDAEAQYHVGMMYNKGIGAREDLRLAFEWSQKAASANDPLGAYELGCYYDGQGSDIVSPDANEALKYKLVVAKTGYVLAQYDVALLYDRQENAREAVRWWKLAGDQGYAKALYNLSGSYFQGKGVPRDLALAYAYCKLSKLAPQNAVDEMAATLSKSELAKAQQLVSQWSPRPPPLTLKAMQGVRAAEEHLKNGRGVSSQGARSREP